MTEETKQQDNRRAFLERASKIAATAPAAALLFAAATASAQGQIRSNVIDET